MAVAGCQGCQNGIPTPATVAGVDLGVCILTNYATDPTCRPKTGNAVTCAEDIAKACGSDAASVAKVLEAHTHAMVSDGIVLAPAGDP